MQTYYMPTRVHMGEECVLKHGLGRFGEKALIVTGKSSARKSGALGDVLRVLERMNIKHDIFDRIGNNPTLQNVYEGGQFARQANADFIIGIGGGSPLDGAKAVAVYAVNDIAPMDIFNSSYKHLPIIAIPTTAGTGSEVTPFSVLTVEEAQTKRSFKNVFAQEAYLDARYTLSLPNDVTADTAADALSHGIESVINRNASALSAETALSSIRMIGECVDSLLIGSLSFAEREKLLLASAMAGIAIAQTGTAIVHQLGYSLTYFKGAPHGRANGALLEHFLRRAAEHMPRETNMVLNALGRGLDEFAGIMKRLTPVEWTVTPEEADKYAQIVISAGKTDSNMWTVGREHLRAYYTSRSIDLSGGEA